MTQLASLDAVDRGATALVERLVGLAPAGLATAYLPETGEFAQTVRGLPGAEGVRVRREGTNTRYAAIAALGLATLPVERQRAVLGGRTAADVARLAAGHAAHGTDPGAVALSTWALAEVAGEYAHSLVERLELLLGGHAPIAAVDLSWLLTAAVAANPLADTDHLVDRAAARLLGHHGDHGIHPHVLGGGPRWRAHVGSFADQVYPVQALARASVLTGDATMLEAADHTAQRLVDHQGAGGQWWWHYDARDGSVVERYPVYSVHQHAMAPMVLFDLLEAGGADHRPAVAHGLRWLDRHPEVVEELVSERFGLVWRKVGRREPPKAARGLAAATTSLRPGLQLRGVDRWLPATRVDHECRPYELGWLLHAWLPRRTQEEACHD
ncbi:hypothetical protein FB382_002916 [Nocardioides ginsengisegetis]|uniref:Mannose or cellobiose epimerase, N-acyl-D-glucosamine 2-epimerase family n=1 Tax=Nocardioides ginsengisegetis TaxID=661491 RepID=A0A7W3J1K6_9ACTN|nr:hypothetical protein [Nocardioides ginsengisegetis]MBA8804625.1 hypothetical protein [Nocardioides ginsengisegetis]